MDRNKPLFVYGTLKKGHGNSGLLRGCELLYTTHIPGRMFTLGGFPGVVPDEDKLVAVEAYQVPDKETWARLDSLEGFREGSPETSMYVLQEVKDVNGCLGLTYIWNLEVPKGRDVEGGVW